jgi:hypothetical protein
MGVTIQSSPPSKRHFGLRTVATAFEYGAFVGLVAGALGGFYLGSTYHAQDLSRTEKAKEITKLSLIATGGIVIFVGGVKLVSSIKIKG